MTNLADQIEITGVTDQVDITSVTVKANITNSGIGGVIQVLLAQTFKAQFT
jgi:hypothetical protein